MINYSITFLSISFGLLHPNLTCKPMAIRSNLANLGCHVEPKFCHICRWREHVSAVG